MKLTSDLLILDMLRKTTSFLKALRPTRDRWKLELFIIALPIALSLAAAFGLSQREVQHQADLLAGLALDRAAQITDQLFDAFRVMHVYAPEKACSASSVNFMRSVGLGSSLLQGVGFLSRGTLQCSSLGSVPTYVGAPDYVSATNTAFRRDRTLAEARRTRLLLVSDSDGYTAMIHPSLLFNLSSGTSNAPEGLVTISNRQTIVSRGELNIDWSEVTLDQVRGVFHQDHWIVAWAQSPDWDHFSYAAIPVEALYSRFGSLCLASVPLGLLAGLVAVFFNRRLAAERQSLPVLLRNGIRRREIVVAYQPIVELATGRWVGAEVLARWRRPSGEWVSPDIFVPIAEKHGIIRELTRSVVAQAVADYAANFAEVPEFFLSINVSSTDLAAPEFPGEMAKAVMGIGLPPSAFHLEVTERAEVKLDEELAGIDALRTQGFALGIDDFGIGYSNLAYIDRLALDYIKIDRVFVANSTQGVIEHIIDIAHENHLAVIAEGIETEDQCSGLRQRGVSYGQGWLFAKPMPASELAAGLKAQLHATSAPETSPATQTPMVRKIA